MEEISIRNEDLYFAKVKLEGTHEEIGFQHGVTLKSRIQQNIEYYGTIFNQPEGEIFKKAEHFKRVISEFNPDYPLEIEALAKGAEVHPGWIYALNSRSEILSIDANECTAIYGRSNKVLGQNWDWAKDLEGVSVVMEIIHAENNAILMLTEPGIIGKIGLNSNGVGVCLNFLRIDKRFDGIPIHILLRAILDSEDIHGAEVQVRKSGYGKAGNVLVGDGLGNAFDVEFAGDESFDLAPQGEVFIHTNHYLKKPLNPRTETFMSSYSRIDCAKQNLQDVDNLSVDKVKEVLSDRSNQAFPIFRPYIPDADIKDCGTVATIIMDLAGKQMHLRKGNSLDHPFETVGFSNTT
jgi:isopenicillin-N N-acyltransferase-like protein